MRLVFTILEIHTKNPAQIFLEYMLIYVALILIS